MLALRVNLLNRLRYVSQFDPTRLRHGSSMHSAPGVECAPFSGWNWSITSLLVVLLLGCSALAQTEMEEVHLQSRTKKVSVNDFSSADSGTLKANVNLVQVSVTVLDRDDRSVPGLEVSNFAVFDDKVPQPIRYFSQGDTPLSVVVVLDASGSMVTKMDYARHAAVKFLNTCNASDEISVITVADKPHLKNVFSDSVEQIRETVDSAQAGGMTSLWDSIYLGVQELKTARLPRKAMVIISDGGDNASRFTQSWLKRLLQESDVQAYGIGFFEAFPRTQEEKGGALWLDEITKATGGQLFTVHDDAQASRAAERISLELRNEYVLSYYPSSTRRDGKWRNIKVQLQSPPSGKFHLYAKKGYYSPVD